MVDIISSNHPTNANTDGFMHSMYKLVDENEYKDRDGNVIGKDKLRDLGVVGWYFLRGADGGRVESGVLSRGVTYFWRVFVIVHYGSQIEEGLSAEDMLVDLRRFAELTKEVTDAANTNNYETLYEATAEVKAEFNPEDHLLVTMDHYLMDGDVFWS